MIYIFFITCLSCRSSPDKINWLAHFNGVVGLETGQLVADYIVESQSKVILGDSYVIQIGNNNIYYLDYTTTDVSSEKLLLNFTYSPELADTSSAAFKSLNTSFCERVSARW